MHAAGLAAFERRDAAATRRPSFGRDSAELDAAHVRRFKGNVTAWKYFESEAPWYRRLAVRWVTSAKKEETRLRRLETLIANSACGRRIGLVPARKR
jgi:hypothetical protein